MIFHTNEDRIRRLKKKFPNLNIRPTSKDRWELVGITENDVEIINFLKGAETMENKIEPKPLQPLQPVGQGIDKPIENITSALSKSLSEISSIIDLQQNQKLALLEAKIAEIVSHVNQLVAKDASIEKSVQNLDVAGKTKASELQALISKALEEVNKISSESLKEQEKKMLDLARTFDEAKRDMDKFKQDEKIKMAKMLEIWKS